MLMSRRVNGKAIVGLGVSRRFELQTQLSERIWSDKVGIVSSDKLLPGGRCKELDVPQRKRLQHEPGEEDLRSFLAYRTHTHRDCLFLWLILAPNAGHQARRAAGARHERTLAA